MSDLGLALDVSVALLLVGLAARLLHTRELFEATVLFIAYGLTLSLAWVRLGAPDVALAEAALGAGVTGALLLNTFHRLSRRVHRASGGDRGRRDEVRGIAGGRVDDEPGVRP